MRIASPIRTRLTSLLAIGALVAGGLLVSASLAPAASADPGPVINPTPSTVTADALPTVQVDGVVWSQVVVGNTVYVAGKFSNARPAGSAPGVNTTVRNNLLAYDITTGNLITSFAPDLNGQALTLAATPDGTKLIVGGDFTVANGSSRSRIAEYNIATGALSATFKPAMGSKVKAVIATNSVVYAGGTFKTAAGVARSYLAAFDATSGALLSWAPAADFTVNAIALTPDGSKLIVGGAFQNINGSPAYGIGAVSTATGALLPWNTTNVIRNAGTASAILTLKTSGNAIYGTGYTFGGGGNFEGAFSANANTGDINWLEDCHGDTYDSFPVNGVVYTVSHAHYCGNIGGFFQSDPWATNMRHAIAFTDSVTGSAGHDPLGYYDFYGQPTPSLINWFPDLAVGNITGQTQAAWSVTGNSQYITLGGEFPTVNGTAQQGLVRFAVKPIAPVKVAPTLAGTKFMPSAVALPSGAIRLGWNANWDKDDKTLTYKVVRNNVQATPIYTTTVDSTFWARPQMGYIDRNVVPGTSYTYRLYATDPAGNTTFGNSVTLTAPAAGAPNAYASRVIADGASPYWPMNEASGTTLYDNAAFTDADTGAGITRGAGGAISGDAATTFDGSTSAGTRTAIQGPNTFTAQVWIKTTSTSGGKILGFGATSSGLSGSYDRHIYMDNAGQIWFGVYRNSVATLNSTTAFNDGQWHQITASLGSDGMKLYVDSKLIGQRGDVTWGQAYQGYWRVGGDNIGGWPNQPSSNYFAGSIDEAAIYPTVLSRQTINAQWVASGRTSTIPAAPVDPYGAAVFNDSPLLYWRLGEATGSSAADSGPSGDQTGSYRNGVTLGASGGIKNTTNTAATFDGADDFVASTKMYSNPLNYSLEAWFKTTSTGAGKIIGFGNNPTAGSDGYDRHVYLDGSGKVYFGTWTGQANLIATSKSFNDGVWHHVVATQSTTSGMSLYLDGALAGTNPQTAAQNFAGYWKVGGDTHWAAGSPYLAATIDDAAVYGSVLTSAQVANHFNLGNTVAPANLAPRAGFTSTSTYLDATFDGSTSVDPDGSVVAYEWNFGDTSPVGTGVTPLHSYVQAGTYTVSLKVTDNRGQTNVATNQIVVTAAPVNAAPRATFVSTVTNTRVDVDGTGSSDPDGSIASYSWDFGDNGTASGATASHSYTAAGTYPIVLTVTDNKGLSNTTNSVVTVKAPANQAPIPDFTITPAQLTVTVNGTASSDPDGSIASYSWDFGDQTSAVTGATATHTYAVAGAKVITLTVTDNRGASNSSSQTVQVLAPPANTPPSPGFHVDTVGLTANLESTSTDSDGTIVSYLWEFGDGGTSDVQSPVHTYAQAGSYSVKLTVTDDSGAAASQTQGVTVSAPPPANAPPTAAFTSTAAGLVAALNASTSTDSDGTIAAYSWAFGDNTTDLVTGTSTNHTYPAAGTYSVTLTVTDNNGATNSVTHPVTVTSGTPTALISDAFTRTLASGFGSADVGGAYSLTGAASTFSVSNGTGKIRMGAAGAGPGVSLDAPSSVNVDITVDVALDKAATGGGTFISVGARKVGNSKYGATVKYLAGGSVQLQLVKVTAGTSTILRTVTVAGLTYAAGDSLTYRFLVTGTTSTVLSAKVWKTGTNQPANWQTTITDASSPIVTTGGVSLETYLSGSSTAGAVVASVDNLKVVAPTV